MTWGGALVSYYQGTNHGRTGQARSSLWSPAKEPAIRTLTQVLSKQNMLRATYDKWQQLCIQKYGKLSILQETPNGPFHWKNVHEEPVHICAQLQRRDTSHTRSHPSNSRPRTHERHLERKSSNNHNLWKDHWKTSWRERCKVSIYVLMPFHSNFN